MKQFVTAIILLLQDMYIQTDRVNYYVPDKVMDP